MDAADAKAPAIQGQLERLGAELTTHDTETVYFNTSTALNFTTNPEIRHALVHRFVRAVDDVALSRSSFNVLVETAQKIIEDPALIDPAITEVLDRAIGKKAKDALADGAELVAIGQKYVPWKVSLGASSTTDTQTLLTIIDSESQKLLKLRPSGPVNQEWGILISAGEDVDDAKRILYIRDYAIQRSVQLAITRGDFRQAGELIHATLQRHFLLQECLEKTINLEQVEVLKPKDEFELMLDPDFATLFSFAEAKFKGDLRTTMNSVIEFARTRTTRYTEPLRKAMMNAYRQVAANDQKLGQEFGQRLLTVLRARRENKDLRDVNHSYDDKMRSELSEALIRGGDTEEMQRAYQEIGRLESPTEQQRALHQLAQLLGEIQTNK